MVLITIQHILSIAAPLAIITGVIIALLQLRSQYRLRQMDIVMKLYSSFGEEAFVRNYQRVTSWEYKTYADFRKKNSREDYVSLLVVTIFFENIGLLQKRRLASLELLDDLLSSPILEAWPKAGPIWVGMREEHNHPVWAEWFEFFHDAMAQRMDRLNGIRSPKKSRPGS